MAGDGKLGKTMEPDSLDEIFDGKSIMKCTRISTRALELVWDPFFGRSSARAVARPNYGSFGGFTITGRIPITVFLINNCYLESLNIIVISTC